jgi:outer membrane protein TolC
MNKYLLIAILPFAIFLSQRDSISQEILKWQDCVKAAKENHPELQSAKEKINQSKANKGIARSGLLPQVDANADLSKSRYESQGMDQTSNSYSYGLTGKQLLFDGGKTIYDMKSSEKKTEASEYNYQVVSASIRQSLRYSFVKLLSAQELLKINKEIARIRKQNLDLVKMRYTAGLEHKGSLLTAEANLSQAEYQVAQAERDILIEQRSLIKDMGIEKSSPYVVTGNLSIETAYNEKPEIEKIAASNPQIKDIISQRISSEYNLQSARLDNSPDIYGVLSANRTGGKWPPNNTQYSAGLQMSFNLFQGGRSYYQSAYAEAVLKQLFADEKSTRSTILFYLEQAWTNLYGNIDAIKVQDNFLKAAEERAKIADAQYSIGAINFDNWTIIQDNLVNAKQNLIKAETSTLLSEADWIQAKGGTLDND